MWTRLKCLIFSLLIFNVRLVFKKPAGQRDGNGQLASIGLRSVVGRGGARCSERTKNKKIKCCYSQDGSHIFVSLPPRQHLSAQLIYFERDFWSTNYIFICQTWVWLLLLDAWFRSRVSQHLTALWFTCSVCLRYSRWHFPCVYVCVCVSFLVCRCAHLCFSPDCLSLLHTYDCIMYVSVCTCVFDRVATQPLSRPLTISVRIIRI